MWRWPVMAAKKAKTSAAKGKIFTIHAKLIALAAQRGANPSENPTLFEAIAKAKKDNVPNENIERAIKKGSGASGADSTEQIIYEGYAPGGVAIVVRALTDNRNRTAPNMRHCFSHSGGSLAESGAVTGFAFDHVWKIVISAGYWKSQDVLEEAIIEWGAEDYIFETDGSVTIWTVRTGLAHTKAFLTEKGYTLEEARLTYRPKNWVEVTDFDNILKIYTLEQELDEDDDVEEIWHNADIADDMWEKAREMVESSKFRT